jgi:hypothetical protein
MLIPTYMPLLSNGTTIVLSLDQLSTYEETGGNLVDSYYAEMKISTSTTWTSL